MGEVIQLRDRGKRRSVKPIFLEEDRLVAAVEQKLAEGEWKLRRKQPRDRADLIVLARNLAQMYRRLPHGEKARALRASGFGGKDNEAAISTYANNLMLPAGVASSDDKRIRRLSTRVKRYVNVAEAIEGDRHRALSYLFRWTSYDRASSDDWQGKLSAKLHRLAVEVAASTDLPRYFDEASAANVCLADDGSTSFRATGWLSETFHKDDFARVQAANSEGGWLYDRNDNEKMPRCGAPLFVPKAAIDTSTCSWMVRRADGTAGELACTFTCTLYVALVPIAGSLNEPCRVECWLFLRPSVALRSGRLPVWQVVADSSGTSIRADDEVFHPVDEAAFRTWSATEDGRLFVEHPDGPRAQGDLLIGSWWCVPATPSAVRQYLAKPRAGGQPLAAEHGEGLQAVLENPDEEPGETDLHALAADLYPPQDTLALEITYGLIDLRDRLTSAADELIGNFQVLQHQVRSASPLSD
ncbi:hypothetical protein PK98_15640 [Croceibacterium mercuriale]|uniref:Uncharacterized protein n=1 Tax=Croceibacterium mercuriale TaxID=1572751 RepID=A0A0B2BVW3_9SPHN|nr:hypothetical protein [Croceibacterium mercuriale]KHL24114.1 hypothetical protein PK98_15640 [Croceibacterium mercuriale]